MRLSMQKSRKLRIEENRQNMEHKREWIEIEEIIQIENVI